MHKLIWVLVILVGLLAGYVNYFPHQLIKEAVERQGNLYLPIQANGMFSDEAIWYMPLSKKIIENHGAVNDFFFEKYQKAPSPIPLLPNYLYSILFLSSQNISQIFLNGIFWLSAILFVAYFLLGTVFFASRIRALFFAGFTSIITDPIRNFTFFLTSLVDSGVNLIQFGNIRYGKAVILNYLDTIKIYLWPISHTLPVNLTTISLTDPLITYLIYIPAIAGLLYFFLKPSRKSAVIPGVLIGLLFHSYLYYAVLLSMVASFYLLYSLILKKEKEILFSTAILLGIIFLFFLAYAYNLYVFQQLPQAAEVSRRIGAEHGFGFHWVVWREYVIYAVFFLLNWLIFKKTQPQKFLFYAFLFVSMFLCYNLQMIFGFMPHPDHWARTFSPLLLIFFFDFIFSWPIINKTSRRKFILDALALACLALIFFTSIFNSNRFKHLDESQTALKLPSLSFDKQIFDSYEWIKTHPGTYISPSYTTTYNLILYSQGKPYLASAANSLAGNYELEQRFLETMKLWNVDPSRLKEILSNQDETALDKDISLNLYINYFTNQSFNFSLVPGSGRAIPNSKIENLVDRYQKIKIDPNDYKGYYFYYGPFEREMLGDFSPGVFSVEPVFSNEKVSVYKII